MVLNAARKSLLARLADALIPAAHGMPSAAEVGVCDGLIDRVLSHRPDIAKMLGPFLDAADGLDADVYLANMEMHEPRQFELFFQAVAGAYYMSHEVREHLGYSGQQALTLPRAHIGAEDLLEVMASAAERFRRVPMNGEA